nr:DUF3418 domain-containing protein [Streptomyces sp. DSM 41633]
SQLDRLLPNGFVAATGIARLNDLARYITAIARRLERLPQGLDADRERMARVHAVEDAYDDLVSALSEARAEDPKVRDIAWQIEELRVSLWAQQLGTPRPVSEQRIYKAIDAVTRSPSVLWHRVADGHHRAGIRHHRAATGQRGHTAG